MVKAPFNIRIQPSLKLLYTVLIVLGFTQTLTGQDTLYYENFDSSPGTKPPGWTTELESGDSKWQFVDGGGTKNPGIPGSRRPPSAYSDTVNALYFFESLEGESVILVTPPVNLEFALKPELRFMHVQREGNLGFGTAHDELRVYYKTHIDSTWTEVRKIAEYTDEVYDWTEQTVLLPPEALVPECYIAFKATTRYGWGVGIDDVRVIETDVQPRWVDAVTIYQDETGFLPTGSRNNPLLRINVSVKGNSGTVALNSLVVNSLNSSDADIETNGVKLHYNFNNQDFFAATVFDTSTFVSGQASFSGMNLSLPSGHTSLWVSYDINADAVHGNLADAMLQAGSINFDVGSFPAGDASPTGSRMIREAVFLDDFSTDRGWTLTGDFERNRPRGLGGQFLGNPDPVFASGDTMVLGNDLTGLGTNIGDYEASVSKYANLATSPAFDLFYYNNVKLNFLRWLNVANNDTASIEMSLDGGSSWNEIWANNNNVFTDGTWKYVSLDLSSANRKSQVQIRYNLGPTTPTDHLSGWNIENFAITGNYVAYDVGPVALLAPVTGCGLSSAETVRIRIENFGPGATPDEIPVRFSIDGGATFSEEVISGNIAFEGQRDFDFTELVDLTAPGSYHVIIETALDVDEEPTNNRLDTILYVDPAYALPYSQNFESGNDYWRVEGTNATFEFGMPVGSIIHTAASGVNAWVTNLDGDYFDNEDSYLLGPCFDFTGIDYPVFECSLYTITIEDEDGASLEYSLNNGQTWSRVGSLGDGDTYGWNWYNSDVIAALNGGHGWTGGPDEWRTARILLDTMIFRNIPNVKFRFHFTSDALNRLEGIGIDDIRIYDAPRDVGVVSIDSPVDGCAQEIGDHVAVTIQNFGLDTLLAGDTLIAGYNLESEPTVIDTFILASDLLRGSKMPYYFTEALEVTSSGTKNIEVFTMLPDDIDFYNESQTNDTTAKSFEVTLTPYVFLPSHIYTIRPDTIVLDAYTGNPSDTYLWQDATTDPVYNVTAIADGIYHVTASNTFCDYSDTTYVHRLIADAGVTGIMKPVSSCELGASLRPRIEVTNFGTDTLQVGDAVPVRYRIDSDPIIEETAVMIAQVFPDSTFQYTFATPSDMSVAKSYDLLCYTELDYDDDLTNDTTYSIIEVYGFTPVDLGPDTVIRAFDYTLDAGAGNDSYLWNDGSSNQTLLIDTTGQYWVTVQAGTMCQNSDTLEVTILVPDIGINGLSNPTDGCGLTASETVEFYIQNQGTDTLQTTDSIFITYQLDADPVVYDTFYVDRKVEPGDSILFSSAGTVDVSFVGTFQFAVNIFFTKDLLPGNNSFNQSVEVYNAPTVSLGVDRVVSTKTSTLDAGSGFISYLWQDGSSGQQYVVDYNNQSSDSVYAVTVTDINGCQASDDLKISFDLWDVGISSIQSPVSACNLTDQEELRLYVTNYGTHPIFEELILVNARVDVGQLNTLQQRISQVLNPGDSVEFLFVSTFDLSGEGDHNLITYCEYGADNDPFNDTVEMIITNAGVPKPELDGGNDSLGTSLPYTLDAGADFVSYLWNGITGNRTYDATRFGWHTLEVTNMAGCVGKDSIYLMNSTGIVDLFLPGELKVYPVPASQVLHVDYRSEEADNLHLEIYDSNGRKIYGRQFNHAIEINETIDVTGIADGVYFLRLRSDEQLLTRKITIY
jgi:hypothetical protein